MARVELFQQHHGLAVAHQLVVFGGDALQNRQLAQHELAWLALLRQLPSEPQQFADDGLTLGSKEPLHRLRRRRLCNFLHSLHRPERQFVVGGESELRGFAGVLHLVLAVIELVVLVRQLFGAAA